MTSGICWPFAAWTGITQELDPAWLRLLKEHTHCTWIRFDCDHRNGAQNARNVTMAIHEGFEVLPILQADYDALSDEFEPGHQGAEQHALNVWAIEFVQQFRFRYVEVLNEPHTMHGMPAEIYADVVNSVGQEIRTYSPESKILVAAEILQPDQRGPTPQRYWLDVADILNPDYWDMAAIHHYREPGPPHVSRWDSRLEEHRYVLGRCKGKPAVTTEIGWRVGEGGVSLEDQAAFDIEELNISHQLGMPFCILYVYTGEFGVLTADGEPRPVADELRQWNIANATRETT